ncbi:hypothetical protein EB796_017053 [Bugula neritina]|uniref:Uncharacterized protein n=1 Tax=Bugula neritina TaxID=10212 RepID=A0A7J7JE86_BUGNE|nr:hypothetical protein EB796_017053 [Bugula neritina]
MVYLLTQKRLRMFVSGLFQNVHESGELPWNSGLLPPICSEFLISSEPIESPHISIHFFWLDTRWSTSIDSFKKSLL